MVDQAQREGVGGMHPSYIPEYPGSKFLIELAHSNSAALILALGLGANTAMFNPGFPISLWYRTARTSRRALISGAPT